MDPTTMLIVIAVVVLLTVVLTRNRGRTVGRRSYDRKPDASRPPNDRLNATGASSTGEIDEGEPLLRERSVGEAAQTGKSDDESNHRSGENGRA